MISVLETWYLRPDTASDVLAVMQAMDDLLGPNAHAHPGWCGHARFFRAAGDPCVALMLYPWRSVQLHEDLIRSEEPMLADFYGRYCARPRLIQYYEELAVEVEHENGHGHGHGHG